MINIVSDACKMAARIEAQSARHPGRRAADEQPEPVERPGRHECQRWEATALVYKATTGKAAGGWVTEPHKLMAANREDVLSLRAQYIDCYLHASRRAQAAHKRTASDALVVPTAQRARRASAPSNLTEGGADRNEGRRGPLPGEGRAGPGRGHILESTVPVEILAQPLMPPPGLGCANWLQQLTLKKQWQTKRIEQLEAQIDEYVKLNAAKARCVAPCRNSPNATPAAIKSMPRLPAARHARDSTIKAQREELRRLEDSLWQVGLSIARGCPSSKRRAPRGCTSSWILASRARSLREGRRAICAPTAGTVGVAIVPTWPTLAHRRSSLSHVSVSL